LTRRRWLLAGTIALAAALSAFWIIGATIAWSVCCGWLVSLTFVIALTIGASVNVLGLLAFVVLSKTSSTPILGAVQVGNILFALVASMAVSPAWLLFVAAPAVVILILAIVFRRFEAGAAAS
jgi:hypothetical protein